MSKRTRGSASAKKAGRATKRPKFVPVARKESKGEGELKFFDTTLSFNFDTTMEVPATGQLSLIPQGDTGSTRDGRKCTVKSVQIRAAVRLTPAAAATASGTAWLYLVQDKQANGATATAAGDGNSVFTSANAAAALIELTNADRFTILKKWVMDFNSSAGAAAALNNVSQHIEYFKALDMPMTFGTAAVDITQIKFNNLFLVAGASGADDLIGVDGTCRLRFVG